MADRSELDIISNMTNVGDSGQDGFVADWMGFAKAFLTNRGVSQKYINSAESAYILAKIVSDMVESGELSNTSKAFIADLRVNHPKSEDAEGGGESV